MTHETLTTLRKLREKATPGNVKSEHDCTESAEETIEYLATDDQRGAAIVTNVQSDVADPMQMDGEHGTRHWDEQGRRNMKYLAALWNAVPELIALAEEALRARGVL